MLVNIKDINNDVIPINPFHITCILTQATEEGYVVCVVLACGTVFPLSMVEEEDIEREQERVMKMFNNTIH